MKAVLALVALALAFAAPALAQLGQPNPGALPGTTLPDPFGNAPHPFNNSHPLQPWDPWLWGGQGRPIAEHLVPERTVVIPMEVPQAGSLPSFYGPVPVTLPSYRVTETTAGFVIHGHWGVEPRNGVYYWTWRPTNFRGK